MAATVRSPVHRSIVAIARSIPHGPPKLEVGLVQTHDIVADARRDVLRGRRVRILGESYDDHQDMKQADWKRPNYARQQRTYKKLRKTGARCSSASAENFTLHKN